MSTWSLTGGGQELFWQTTFCTRCIREGLKVQFQSCAITSVHGHSAQVPYGLSKLFQRLYVMHGRPVSGGQWELSSLSCPTWMTPERRA